MKERYIEEDLYLGLGSLSSENCAVAESAFTIDEHIFVRLAPCECDDGLLVDLPADLIVRYIECGESAALSVLCSSQPLCED